MIIIIIFIALVMIFRLLDYFITNLKYKKQLEKINQDSYQRYAKFFGNIVPSDGDFNAKVNKILDSIKFGETDIKTIAEKSNCTYPECILKIKYLKNKRLIDNYYVDSANLIIYPCTKEDEKLVNKYKLSIYQKHLSINEMADSLYQLNPYNFTKEEYKDKIFNDLKYLDSKNLLSGIVLNDVDKTIKYYSVEKKKGSNLVTVHCPNCGALNDVDVNSKTRCSYCNTIISADKTE